MSLQDKYKELIDTARSSGTDNLQVNETDGVLHISGEAPSGAVKDNLWNIYGKIDPNFLTGDVVMDIKVATAVEGAKLEVVTQSSNLNVRKGPGTDQPIIGKAGHKEIVSLVSKHSDQWWLIRTKDGEEGYAHAQYLRPVE
ncbi:SH3 domain-containing protein [Chitinophaga pinensis]|uniref:SH3 type 3 domain protein n=2 Tax=Chitinophaga pinensis TaxID=79329 RepID=A0A979GRB8_CHIPD|nr:SH3 domain-containing protein [Chitinophaga pinensis]ACU60813.1 SH3 type 3 domain protein [Chitinophaga pinensis DSM 2588]TWV99873.1 SH3 domain-containing protein [Chitinophaga pinensis]